eukprot:PhF_6_TR9207/c1_g1_i8/m.14446/K00759/APRT, apt; adenine phosphoribosyltransferase
MSLFKTNAPFYQSLDPEHPVSKKITAAMRWYSPQFSPKDVPRFCDLASLCENPEVFTAVVNVLAERYRGFARKVTHIAGYESRGFILAAPLAIALGVPCIMLRKCGKNCGVLVVSSELKKEYTETNPETMSLRVGSIKPGDNVILIDDLLGTGGTAITGFEVVLGLGASVAEFVSLTELGNLNGVQKIRAAQGGRFAEIPVFTLVDLSSIGEANQADPKGFTEKSRIVPLNEAEAIRQKYNLV